MREKNQEDSSIKAKEVECEDCGESIPEKRRLAIPGCKLCILCQQEYERAGKYTRHSMDYRPNNHCGEVENVEAIFFRGS